MIESNGIRKSMNSNKSLIEAARLKKKAEKDDKEIKKQVEQIKSKSLFRGLSKQSARPWSPDDKGTISESPRDQSRPQTGAFTMNKVTFEAISECVPSTKTQRHKTINGKLTL